MSSSNHNPDKSLTTMLMNCHLDESHVDPAPQSQIEMNTNDSVSSMDADESSSVISVSSIDSSIVSYLHTSQFISSSEVSQGAITIEETTTDSEAALSASRPGSADVGMSASSSLKRHSPDPEIDDLQIKKRPSTSAAAEVVSSMRAPLKRGSANHDGNGPSVKKPHRDPDVVATPSNRSVVTRSGRAVVLRKDLEFDYTSPQGKDEDEDADADESDDPSLETNDEDDADYQLATAFEEPLGSQWPCRKRRSIGNSSSSACSTDGSHSSPESPVPPIIFLELGLPVAIVWQEPLADLDLESDGELKTKVHKFLGLVALRRKLYNPQENGDAGEPAEIGKEVANLSLSCLLINSICSPAKPATTPSPAQRLNASPATPPSSSWASLNLSHLNPPTQKERQTKMFDNFVLLANASSFEAETPDFLKEPIDLSELPSHRQRAIICRRHKGSVPCLDNHPDFYRFVESLDPVTSINFCHPLALDYRQKNFETCKVALAKRLFNIFNHAIFRCGLVAPILWKRGIGTPCKAELAIDANGKRTARILLWENISHPCMLIKPLLHEMIHAAAFVFNRETGHGDSCRRWAYQAKHAMPELPAIADCQPTFKYTCSLCARCAYGRIDFPKDQLRCHYCQFEVGVKKYCQADLFTGSRPDPTVTPFRNFVREHYLKLGEVSGTTHSAKMRLLNEQYSKINPTCC
ncbi:germ cell nuclear acidic protein isoform X2 [Drosophila gunungcola]|uniref:germ cell nuclear acidic protein isoform X2 n=1 Tax=Drosophila gunungcola TaxID=103775 RepID=UPI0022E76006|nr:germ cell nuclear acidic protein isoform X2 [Drosophila gunungcola]